MYNVIIMYIRGINEMKKIILSLTLISLLTLVSCGNKDTSQKEVNDINFKNKISNLEEDKTTEKGIDNGEEVKEYLSSGDIFHVESEIGNYDFKIIEAKYLGPHDGDSNSFERVQVTWEVNNISFNGWEEDDSGNKLDEGFCQVPAQALRVKDDNNYILDEMLSGWEGDFSNFDKKVYIGEKIIQKYTWILNDKDTENLYISFSRMGDEEYKIKITR